jgi:hypothetical protein
MAHITNTCGDGYALVGTMTALDLYLFPCCIALRRLFNMFVLIGGFARTSFSRTFFRIGWSEG